ncbi:uncharacterized protein LOC113679355 [Pocillopora damicornis]|uniref:uncharacterized protein LOC113679355 n=1 Tax=Pocillopora damicornis TaxID=46731 RepID=UPI000F54F11A|nr:uncharacterized protein LOC113679355 [Pocillopora damicornis]
MTAKVFFFVIAVLFVMQIEANPLYDRDFFRRLHMQPMMDEHPDAYARRRLEPMMDETPDEYIARREELIHGRGLCENENKAYCEQWKAYCDQPAFFINENRYKMFVNKMCTAACNRCK